MIFVRNWNSVSYWLLVLQPIAFHCWSSRTWTGPTLSIVRGRSSKSDSTIRKATTGSVTTCFTSWQRTAAISWDLICRHATIAAGSTRNIVRSLCQTRQATIRYRCLGIWVTQGMHFLHTAVICSPRMTVTTICGFTSWGPTVQCSTAVDSGTLYGAAGATSTLFAVVEIASGGGHLEISTWIHHGCGWRARSLLCR